MGAVGALAPTIFESVGTSIHGFFWQILSKFYQFKKKDTENITDVVISWQKVNSSTHSLKFLGPCIGHLGI